MEHFIQKINGLLDDGAYKSAISCCNKAIDKHPEFYIYYEKLAAIYLFKKKYDVSRDYYRKALSLNPKLKWIESKLDYIETIKSEYKKNLTNITSTFKKNAKPFCGKYMIYPDLTGKRKLEGGLRVYENPEKAEKSLPDRPLVTIVTVVYNNKETLERCIKSVLNQTYNNIEYIIIDGGSDSQTLEIIKKYSEKIDYFISEPDKGIYNAMNKGIEVSRGDYICLLNSDDIYEYSYVEEAVALARQNNSSIVYTYHKTGQSVLTTEGINEGVYLGHLNICHNTFLVSKSCYDNIGRYSEDYKIVSDAVWIRKAYRNGIRFDLLKKPMFTLTGGGLSSGNTAERRNLFISEVARSYIDQFPFLSYKEAENIYLFRFNKTRVSEIIKIADKHKDKANFISSLSKYAEYCFKHRDNFKLSHTDSDGLFLEVHQTIRSHIHSKKSNQNQYKERLFF